MVLLDLDSQKMVIRKSLAEELELPVVGEEFLSFSGIGGESDSPAWRKRQRMRISSSFAGAEKFEIEAVDEDVIADAIPAYPTLFAVRLKDRGLKLADHGFLLFK